MKQHNCVDVVLECDKLCISRACFITYIFCKAESNTKQYLYCDSFLHPLFAYIENVQTTSILQI